jgi:hypothetical protein
MLCPFKATYAEDTFIIQDFPEERPFKLEWEYIKCKRCTVNSLNIAVDKHVEHGKLLG